MSDNLPAQSWARELRQAWLDAGRPSYREVSRNSGLSTETVRQALNGTMTARRRTVKAIADVLCSPVVSDQIVRRWELDQEEKTPPPPLGVLMPAEVMWLVMPADLHAHVDHYFNILGYELRLLDGQTWAVLPKEGD